jgi:4-alpha-glucanotransferase
MEFKRAAGILLHPTSFPGNYGIGDLGENAYKVVDFLKSAGQTLWQIFPLGPTGFGDSPYQCFSAFAGNPLLISPDELKKENLLSSNDLKSIPFFDSHKIDFGRVINYKTNLLQKSFTNFKKNGEDLSGSFEKFCRDNSFWLDDYSLFMAVKEYHGGILWREWDKTIAFRKAGSIEKWKGKLQDKIKYQKFIQFMFFKQWFKLKKYANENNIQVIGDLPIFIAYDSADLWANRNLFTINEDGTLNTVAGVPPDYFSPTGQLWGNPLYKWDEMEKNNFFWWQKRFAQMFKLVDIVRVDHFRGFEAYYEIPGDAPTAETGKWVKAPGDNLFAVIKEKFGDIPIIAEDLGVITDEVKKLRDKYEFPGMKILQFAFGKNGDKNFLPHNYIKNCVVYSGSHDNDTTRGFFENEKKTGSDIYEWAQKYLNYYGNDIRFAVILAAYSSVANTVIIPMQDILNLNSEGRMNFPGRAFGNWTWRFTWDQISEAIPNTYKELAEIYERPPLKGEE